MTISILAYDEKTGAYGSAAMTGSLCVGAWVLRGDAESGLSASQGSLPSTLWGTQTLDLMRSGASAEDAVNAVTTRDSGRNHRQLAVLDPAGHTAGFTGAESIPVADALSARHVIVSGNLLTSKAVLDRCIEGYLKAEGSLDQRLLTALHAAADAGGDSRGLLSAALRIFSRKAAPLSLRIDHASDPLADLNALHRKATSGAYAEWTKLVPTLDDPERAARLPEEKRLDAHARSTQP